MLKITNLLLPVKYTDEDIKNEIKKKLHIGDYDIISFEVLKSSHDQTLSNKSYILSRLRQASNVRCGLAVNTFRLLPRFLSSFNTFITFSFADITFNINIRQEVHFYF